jgi:hypothetical protein
MTKYKLIKEYPGSPKLGTIAEKESKIKSNTSYYYKEGDSRWCIYDYHVEDNPEYWEKVNEYLWWVVFTKEEALFKTCTPYLIETYGFHKNDSRQYFKTKEEAEEFILDNKPCLSYTDIMWNFQEDTKKNTLSIHKDMLIALIKSKL